MRSLYITLFKDRTGIKQFSGEPVTTEAFYDALLERWDDKTVDVLVRHFYELDNFHMLPHASPVIWAKLLLLLGADSRAWG